MLSNISRNTNTMDFGAMPETLKTNLRNPGTTGLEVERPSLTKITYIAREPKRIVYQHNMFTTIADIYVFTQRNNCLLYTSRCV